MEGDFVFLSTKKFKNPNLVLNLHNSCKSTDHVWAGKLRVSGPEQGVLHRDEFPVCKLFLTFFSVFIANTKLVKNDRPDSFLYEL